ncbi:hypothetical protein Tco_0653529 [Tanacetum coccineum]|uniref:Reverse transcriptase domain-containing protein n=1 Tax=Tanacetum coccineum TaxID=301880 RepID=A0ABQ4X156_9ASTR
MRTRSQSRNLHHQQQQAPPPVVEPFNQEEPISKIQLPPPSFRWRYPGLLAQLPKHPRAIILDMNKGDPHAQSDYFNKITSTMKFPNVPSTSDSLNSAAGGNFLDKMPRDCLRIIESKSKVRNSRNKPVVAKPPLAMFIEIYQEYVSQAAAANYNQGNTGYRAPIANQIRPPGFPPVQNNHNVQNQGNNQNRYNQNRGNFNQASAYQPPVHQGQIYRPQVVQPPAYQAPAYQAPAPQIQGVSKEDFQAYVKANDAVMRNMQTQGQNMQNQLTNLTDMLSKFVTSNTASTSGTLPSNTVTNPKEDLKGITTRSGVAYKGPTIPITSSPKVMERETEVTKDTMPPTNNGSTEDVQPPVVPVVHHESISEPVNAPVSALMPNQKASIPFPSRRNDERRREKANDQIEKFYEIFRDLSFEISFTDALMLMPKFASTLKTLIRNKEKLSEMARTPLNENCSAVILNKLPKKGEKEKLMGNLSLLVNRLLCFNAFLRSSPRVPEAELKLDGNVVMRVADESVTLSRVTLIVRDCVQWTRTSTDELSWLLEDFFEKRDNYMIKGRMVPLGGDLVSFVNLDDDVWSLIAESWLVLAECFPFGRRVFALFKYMWVNACVVAPDCPSPLDSLGRDMKKLKENVHAIQVRCKSCGGAHPDKECPLNEEVMIVEEVKYGNFGRPFQNYGENSTRYHVGPPGYSSRTDNIPPFRERKPSLTEIINKYMEESAKKQAEHDE